MRMEEKCMELTLAQNHSNEAKGAVLNLPSLFCCFQPNITIILHF